jgi:2-methylisocitrate lyase-like PEP mutase family enzyme
MANCLRELLSEKIVVCPGIIDGISAHVAIRSSAACLYMTGAGTTASRRGQPDLGIATVNDFVENGRMIASLSPVPVICDADTGFGGPINVATTVQLYQRVGIVALLSKTRSCQNDAGTFSAKPSYQGKNTCLESRQEELLIELIKIRYILVLLL